MAGFGKERPVAALMSSESTLEGLLSVALSISRKDGFVLILREGDELEGRLLPAYLNAHVRYAENGMRSGSLQKEVLLFVSGTMNIANAIKLCGAVSNKRFMAFTNDQINMKKFVKETNSKVLKECILVLDNKVSTEVALAGLQES